MKASANKNTFFLNKQKVQYSLSIFLFILLFGFGYYHATKGIDLTDEGMYVSTPMRYSLGDVPFRDEIMNATRPFDVLLSPIFKVFPDLSLLQIRLVGLGLHSVSIVVLFLFLSRFAPPLIVAMPCAVSFIVSKPYNIFSPSYNSLSSDLSLLALTLWLISLASNNKVRRRIFSSLGGLFCALAILSYSTLIVIVGVPLAVAFIGLLSFEKKQKLFYTSIPFVKVFAIVSLIVVVAVMKYGLMGDIIDGFRMTVTSQGSISGGLMSRPMAWIRELLQYAKYGLMPLGTVGLASFIIIKWDRPSSKWWLPLSVVVVALFGGLFLVISRVDWMRWFYKFVFSYAVLLALAGLFFNIKDGAERPDEAPWKNVYNIGIAWSLLLSMAYGVSSSGGLRNSLLGFTPLFVFSVIASHRITEHHISISSNKLGNIRKILLSVVILIVPLFFFGVSIEYSYYNIYREADVSRLTEKFKHPKLKGIHSTPEKVEAVEELLRYLNGRVEPKDYFLAYNYIPMLYFLTHTRPAYGTVWARDDWPILTRKNLLKQMIDNNKIPEYCVRMLVYPGSDWNVGMSYVEDSPLDAFVNSHYYLEKIIYPFEIWHRGYETEFIKFTEKLPVYESHFSNWKGPDTINMRDLAKTAAPLINLGNREDFNFTRILTQNGNIIRVLPIAKEKNNEFCILFGYWLNKNGFDLKLNPAGKEIVFMISARLSNSTKKPTTLFIQDKTKRWKGNSISINKTFWDQYIVSKKIRVGMKEVCFGVYWQPENVNEWLEIKDVRVFIIDDSCSSSSKCLM